MTRNLDKIVEGKKAKKMLQATEAVHSDG